MEKLLEGTQIKQPIKIVPIARQRTHAECTDRPAEVDGAAISAVSVSQSWSTLQPASQWPELQDPFQHSSCRWSDAQSRRNMWLPLAIPVAPPRPAPEAAPSVRVEKPADASIALGGADHSDESAKATLTNSKVEATAVSGGRDLAELAAPAVLDLPLTPASAAFAEDAFVGSEAHRRLAQLHSSAGGGGDADASRLLQGSSAWHRARAGRMTASSAAAAAGLLPPCFPLYPTLAPASACLAHLATHLHTPGGGRAEA
jgi:hypothetical protein